MPFTNPIVGGNKLIREAIQSPNYVAGSSGWTINRDGTAEFAQATIRGNVVIVGNTTSGNIEIASSGGYATIKFYNIAHTDFAQISTQDIGGSPQIVISGGLRPSTIAPGNPNVRPVIKQDPTVNGTYIGQSANISGTPVIGGQVIVSDIDVNLAVVDSNNNPKSTYSVGNGSITYQHDMGTANLGGFSYDPNAIPTVDYFTQIGWGLWQNVVFQNGWSNLGGNWATGQYRLDTEGRVELKGVILGGTKADFTTIFNLPAPFRPPKDVIVAVAPVSSGASTIVHIRIFTNGNVQIFGMAASGTGNIGIENASFSVRP